MSQKVMIINKIARVKGSSGAGVISTPRQSPIPRRMTEEVGTTRSQYLAYLIVNMADMAGDWR